MNTNQENNFVIEESSDSDFEVEDDEPVLNPKSDKNKPFCQYKDFTEDNTKYKLYEGLYYVVYNTAPHNDVYLMNQSDIKACIKKFNKIKTPSNHKGYILELYKDIFYNAFTVDLDKFETVDDYHNMILILNDILNSEDIKSLYAKLTPIDGKIPTPHIDVFSYGEYPDEQIKTLYANDDLNEGLHIHYQRNKNIKKPLSAHVIMNCYITHQKLREELTGRGVGYLTDTQHINKLELDDAIYGKVGLLRISSSWKPPQPPKEKKDDKKDTKAKKTKKEDTKPKKWEGPFNTALDLDDDEFSRQFYTYPHKITDDDQTIYKSIFDFIIKEYTIFEKPKKAAKPKLTVSKQPKDGELLTANKEITPSVKGLAPPPLGLIAEILSHYKIGKHNEFICCVGNEWWEAYSGFILNCPYTYDQIENIIYKAYNANTEHNDPWGLNTYTRKAMEGRPIDDSDVGIHSLLKPFKNYISFDEYLDSKAEDETEEEDYFDLDSWVMLNNKGYNRLLLEERKEYKQLRAKLNELHIQYNNTYGQRENLYKKYLNDYTEYQIFNAKRTDRTLTRYDYYVDFTTKEVCEKNIDKYEITFNNLPRQTFTFSYNVKIDFAIISNQKLYKEMFYNYTLTSEQDYENAQAALDIYKNGFKYEEDYKKFMDFLRFKTNNPEKCFRHNFANFGGKDSLKTTIMKLIGRFYDVCNLYPDKLTSTFNTEFASSIVVIEEMPTKQRNAETSVARLKAQTSDETFNLEGKNKDKKQVNNKANIVINSNFKELGGIFNYQMDGEMFKRFYIIEKQTIQKDDIKKFFQLMKSDSSVKALIETIKGLPPLSDEEWDDNTTQQAYYNFVKTGGNRRNVLTLSEIDSTIRPDKQKRFWAKLVDLMDMLKSHGVSKDRDTERQTLEKEDVITYYSSSGKCYIKDLVKYYQTYYKVECDDDDIDLSEENIKKRWDTSHIDELVEDDKPKLVTISTQTTDELVEDDKPKLVTSSTYSIEKAKKNKRNK